MDNDWQVGNLAYMRLGRVNRAIVCVRSFFTVGTQRMCELEVMDKSFYTGTLICSVETLEKLNE